MIFEVVNANPKDKGRSDFSTIRATRSGTVDRWVYWSEGRLRVNRKACCMVVIRWSARGILQTWCVELPTGRMTDCQFGQA
jgi:hypothetical protein